MGKKVKVGVLVSALWVFGWLIFFVSMFPPDNDGSAAFILFTFGPLLLGWGIWWVMKSDKSE